MLSTLPMSLYISYEFGEIHSKNKKSIDQCNHVLFIEKLHQKIQYPILNKWHAKYINSCETFLNSKKGFVSENIDIWYRFFIWINWLQVNSLLLKEAVDFRVISFCVASVKKITDHNTSPSCIHWLLISTLLKKCPKSVPLLEPWSPLATARQFVYQYTTHIHHQVS